MGNRWSTRPTRDDYKAYVDDLAELHKFLNEKFAAGHLRSDSEFNAAYLEALRIKLRQLQNMRLYATSRSGGRAGTEDLRRTLTTLLDALEPQCQRAIDQLSRLQENVRCSS